MVSFSEELEKKQKNMEEILGDVHEEEMRMSDYKKEKKAEQRKRKLIEAAPEEDDLDPELKAMMGFGGFSDDWEPTGHCCPLHVQVKALQDLLYRQPAVRMNMDRWKTFVRQQPRNYSMIIMFTALSPGVNCPICK
ncbi:hypothetical protein OESDEN_19071 [Oesophagostomum dentatum]|uniref:Uncharacterized protein n=1 Tax=Oesophagostomum dentatum TaxID=61180 RepID=A0A0B1S7G6_OESDE|nr:hypothetical protein OESDEN_19071 [Oesophagostomum dentatum]